jgi:diguanylate cyclase (GGDEF)-like protein
MIGRWLAIEAAFDTELHSYRVRADGIMVKMNFFLLLICFGLAPLHQTWLELLLIGLPTILMSIWLWRCYAGSLGTRLFMASSFMVFTGLIIHQTNGDIEAHFAAFGLIGGLLYYRDWRTIVVATVVIYLHHLLLGYAQTLGMPIYVFDNHQFWLLFGIHVAYFLPFIGMMVYLSIWLRREGYESQHVIELAQKIIQGHLMDDGPHLTKDHQTPLINAVRTMKSRLLDLLRVIPVATAVIRIDTENIVSVNEAWVRTIGPLDVVDNIGFGQSPIWIETNTWSELIVQLHQAKEKLLSKIEVTLKKVDGTEILCELSIILHEDVVPVMAILTIEDITLRRKTENTISRLAFRDMLTDLPNRTSLQMDLESTLAQWVKDGIPFSVVMMDLDGFKPVNDTHGHHVGDDVLKIVGIRLLETLGLFYKNSIAARLGGDEFVIVLHECRNTAIAVETAQRCIDAISQPIKIGNNHEINIRIGASAGVAHISAITSVSVENILKSADIALYAAKANGKNQVREIS